MYRVYVITMTTCEDKLNEVSPDLKSEEKSYACGLAEKTGVQNISKTEAQNLAETAKDWNEKRKEGTREYLGIEDEDEE